MTEKKCSWQTFKAESTAAADRLKELLREGNVRRVVIQQNGRTIAEFPLTAGVVGVVLAPVLAAVGAVAAVVKDCTIQVERDETDVRRREPAGAPRGEVTNVS